MSPDEYLKLAEVEDQMWYFRALHALVEDSLGKLRPADGPLRLLDAGCGTGGLLLRMRAGHPDWQLAGIDFSPLAVDLARQRLGPGVDLREASVANLPYNASSFDAVVSADVICQIENPAAAVSEFFRVLRPGGVVVINVPAYMWLWSYHDDSCHTKRRFVRGELDALLANVGFTAVATSYRNMLPLPLIAARRKLLPRAKSGSDVKLYHPAVEKVFGAMAAAEQGWLRRRHSLPAGSSVYAVAQKPG